LQVRFFLLDLDLDLRIGDLDLDLAVAGLVTSLVYSLSSCRNTRARLVMNCTQSVSATYCRRSAKDFTWRQEQSPLDRRSCR